MAQGDRRVQPVPPRQRVRDLPGRIKYVMLLLLILLVLAELAAGEYRPIVSGEFGRIAVLAWIILLIKLLLIALLFWLIWVQRHTCVPPPSNMVAWWSGDQDGSDRQGVLHGTLTTGAVFA